MPGQCWVIKFVDSKITSLLNSEYFKDKIHCVEIDFMRLENFLGSRPGKLIYNIQSMIGKF